MFVSLILIRKRLYSVFVVFRVLVGQSAGQPQRIEYWWTEMN